MGFVTVTVGVTVAHSCQSSQPKSDRSPLTSHPPLSLSPLTSHLPIHPLSPLLYTYLGSMVV